MPEPEQAARAQVDAALQQAGWRVQNYHTPNLTATRGVAVREFQLAKPHGAADYLLFVDGEAVGVVEAKPEGFTLTGVELQAERYSKGLPGWVEAPVQPLPFLYQSTGVETRFTNTLDPDPQSRSLFHFHCPATLAEWLRPDPSGTRTTFRGRLRSMPPLVPGHLWPAQRKAVDNLEASLAKNRPRALVQMATGSGKTIMAISAIYRLIKFGGVQRVLILVDRRNLGEQTFKEFQQYDTPDDGRKFTELYNVQLLSKNFIDPVSKVCITTIQRLFSMLQGEDEFDPALEEESHYAGASGLIAAPVPITYNPMHPIELFDLIITDECHRSIYNQWRQVLEYFDAFLVGLTATPSKQTLGFFRQNLVMEYDHEQAVADGVNVDYDVFSIKTQITSQGGTLKAGWFVDYRNRATRKKRWQAIDEDIAYDASDLDRDVVAEDQIRTVVGAFRDNLPVIFPGRAEVPKTLIYAKDDSHADDIVQIVREAFGRGNDFAQKITYKTTGVKPEDLLSAFRNSFYPRIVVTVDMIATGTDIKPLEIVMFMRAVKSRIYFEQMKGRGVRTVDDATFQAVTPGGFSKTRFVLIDCVGVCEQTLVDTPPIIRDPTISFDDLLKQVAYGKLNPVVLSSLAGRLLRLNKQLTDPQRTALTATAGGTTIVELAQRILHALDPDSQVEAARIAAGLPPDAEPSPEQVTTAAQTLLTEAAVPIKSNPELQQQLKDVKKQSEQAIDTVTQDHVLSAGYSAEALEKAKALTVSFEQFITDHKDELTALQVLYSKPYAQRLRYSDIKQLAHAIKAPPHAWSTEELWRAYETLDKTRVHGSAGTVLTNIVSLVRYALQHDAELVPFPEHVRQRFDAWLSQQEASGRHFTAEQRQWLALIRDHIAGNAEIQVDDFDLSPFNQQGGPGRALQVFGQELPTLLEELNEVLAA